MKSFSNNLPGKAWFFWAVLLFQLSVPTVGKPLHAAFGEVVRMTPITGQGTWVEVPPSVGEEVFQSVAREAIAVAQEASNSAYRILYSTGEDEID